MMRWLLTWAVCLLSVAGCRSAPAEAPSPEPAPPVEQEAEEEEPSLLDEVPMMAAQRKYAGSLLRNFRHDFAPYEECRERMVTEIAAEVRRGATDRTKLEPLIDECTLIYEELLPVFMRFFDDLHAMLSTAQRKRVVALAYGEDEEETGLSEHEQIRQEQEGFLEALDLSTGQKARMFPPLLGIYFRYMGPIGQLRRSMREAKDAFIGSDFDAKQLSFFTDVDWRPLSRAILEAGEVLLGVLGPEQWEILADQIEKRW